MSTEKLVIGVDFGTDSVRTVIVDSATGDEVSSSVHEFTRWSEGRYCDPASNQFRQHPMDYLEGMEKTVREALGKAPPGTADSVVGLTADTTGSTPVAVDHNGTPLALTPGFEENPAAMFMLWKDHTSVVEADEINRTAGNWGGEDFTRYVGGIYSSEWFWAKILHGLRTDGKVREAAFSWVEHCDWIPALLTGDTDPLTLKRSRCAAGHKAMWHSDFGGLPSEEFLVNVDPLLKELRDRLYTDTWTVDTAAGALSPEWADRLGLHKDVTIGVGALDAHLGAVGGEIAPYFLSKVMGTSTCDMLVAPMEEMGGRLIRGICGQVDGSIIPGMLGMEAGQSAFGDIYAWFRQLLMWPIDRMLSQSGSTGNVLPEDTLRDLTAGLIPTLSAEAEKLPPEETGIVALDWLNGRRTPDANHMLKGAITGLTLGSDAPRIFRALVEATAFGAKKIVERFISEGIQIRGVIALGGIPKKSPFVMQVIADVLDMPIKVAGSEQACALGSAMAAAVASGLYQTIEESQKAMGKGFETEYKPDSGNAQRYRTLYERYSRLGTFIEKKYETE